MSNLESDAQIAARRAKAVQDACLKVGISDPATIAAAIIANAVEAAAFEVRACAKHLDYLTDHLHEIGGGS